VGAEICAQSSQAFHDGGEVDGPGGVADTQFRGIANGGDAASDTEQCFGGDAAKIQAVTAQQTAFDERHFGSQPRGSGSRHQPGSTAADDDEVIDCRGLWQWPVGRMHLLQQSSIAVIIGRQQRR